MTQTPTIYDWRASLVPASAIYVANGRAVDGGMTIGGARNWHPEPGGRGSLEMNFGPIAVEQANVDASWTASRIRNGAVMRIPVHKSVQLIPSSDLSGPSGDGLPWSNQEPWAGGNFWEWRPYVTANVAALKGTTEIQFDMSSFGEVAKIGHVIGYYVAPYEFACEIMDISYDASSVATAEISPPLRRDITTSTRIHFRPKMMGVRENPGGFANAFQSGRHMAAPSVRFVEALV